MPEKCHRCGGSGLEPDDRAVGREMRDLRERRGLTLRQLAARLELSPAYISDLERGNRHWHKGMTDSFKSALRAARTPLDGGRQ